AAIDARSVLGSGVFDDPVVAHGTKPRVQLRHRAIGKIDTQLSPRAPEVALFAAADVDVGHTAEREASWRHAQLLAIERDRERPFGCALAIAGRNGFGCLSGVRHDVNDIARGAEWCTAKCGAPGAPSMHQSSFATRVITMSAVGMPVA